MEAAKLDVLSSNKERWARLGVDQRIKYLWHMLDILRDEINHHEWATQAASVTLDSTVEGNAPSPIQLATEMLVNTRIITNDLETLIDSLAAIRQTGAAPVPSLRPNSHGFLVADVFPRPWMRSDYAGPTADWRAELWLQKDKPASQSILTAHEGKVVVVLAAGNQGFLGICDALYFLFIRSCTVVIKHHPVRAYNHAWVEKLFAPLIRDGFLSSVVMDVPLSSALVRHPLVDAIHMTGGVTTHNMIVWGSPAAPAPQSPVQPLISIPVTSELGAITPWIILPAAWNDADVEHHAKYLATAMSNNASCNCNSPKLLVLPDAWPLCDKFIVAFEEAVSRLVSPYPYYPGTGSRYEQFLKQHGGQCRRITSKIPAAARSLPWVIIDLPFEQCMSAPRSSSHPYSLQHEPFAPIISVVRVKHGAAASNDVEHALSLQTFLDNTLELVNNHVMGTLSCTLIVHPTLADAAAVQGFVADLRYGVIGINCWTGQCFQFATATWGAYPGETLHTIESGIGIVRNYMMFDHPLKSVVKSPFLSIAHIGTAPPPTLQAAAETVRLMTAQVDGFQASNVDNGFVKGNFLPLQEERQYTDLPFEGEIPQELDGMFMRNGANMRFESTGKVHMFDGDAMLHCFRFKNGRVLAYANTWIRSKRFQNNDLMQKEVYPSVGDLSTGGLSIAKKMSRIQLAMRSGMIPHLPDNMRGSPSTSTVFVGGSLYAVVEVSPPFRIGVDPVSCAVSSGDYNDFQGRVREFSAHSKVSPDTGELHFAAADHITAASPSGSIDMTYGVVSPNGELTRIFKFPLSFPGPAYLHDYFVTKNFCIVIDHSVRYNISRIAQGSIFQWMPSKPLRFGVISRCDDSAVRWFDTGAPGFVWHVLAGWEEEGSRSVVLWLPIFDSYPETIPIHLPCEPPSHLTRVVLDLDSGLITAREKFMLDTAVERCDVNRQRFGSEQRWGYLMKRSHDHPMYDGFVKFDLKNAVVNAVVEYGDGCLGGECFFIPKASAECAEDAGWYSTQLQQSHLCIWDAERLHLSTQPIARVAMPHRVPFGVHSNFLDAEELQLQWTKFQEETRAA